MEHKTMEQRDLDLIWHPCSQMKDYETLPPMVIDHAQGVWLYDIHGKADILDDPYYNPSLTRDREDFSESGDLRNLKEGKVTVRWRNA